MDTGAGVEVREATGKEKWKGDGKGEVRRGEMREIVGAEGG